MGAKNSRLPPAAGDQGQPSDPSSSLRPTPYIEAPYAGPWAEYQFVDVTVPVEADVTFTFSDVKMASTNCSSLLSTLAGVYSQGYSLVTFCRVPCGGGSSQRRVFSPGKEVHYQGIFCRYEGDPGNEGWNLRAEKSLLQAHHVTPGVVATEMGPGAQHVQQVISSTVQTGGRLLTVQWSGQPQQSSTEAALGVDVFFEVPEQDLPERSVYQLVTAPATIIRRSLFGSKGHVTCDWAGILSRHLARGWRLVDIFCEVPVVGSLPTALSPANVKIQTVWFFEKPEARARDDSAVYEGTIVEHWLDVTSSSSSSSSIISGSAAGCLGGSRDAVKKGGGAVGKKNAARRLASMRKKTDDDACGGSDSKVNDDVRQESGERKDGIPAQQEDNSSTNRPASQTTAEQDTSNTSGGPHQTVPVKPRDASDSAGWEGMIRSMGEKGWELATIVNTLDCQTVSGRPKIKVLLVFQRRLSLAMTVKGRRTSDGLALRADTGASTSVLCDVPLMCGETTSHLNPSLAVRLPLSRSASREHDEFNASCDDDIPSTIGGTCSRTHSATELSVTGRVIESGLLEPRRGSRRGREEGLLQTRGSVGDEGSTGTGGRSSPSSQHSKVTAAEIHSSGEKEASEEERESARDNEKKLSNQQMNASADNGGTIREKTLDTVESVSVSDDSLSKAVMTQKRSSGQISLEKTEETLQTLPQDGTSAASRTGGNASQASQKHDPANSGKSQTSAGSVGTETVQISTCDENSGNDAQRTEECPDIASRNETAASCVE